MSLVFGNQLTRADQQEALRCFTNRFTCDHVPLWARKPAPSGRFYAPQYASDAEWLSKTQFEVTARGKLSKRAEECQSANESWPKGQWLNAPFQGSRA